MPPTQTRTTGTRPDMDSPRDRAELEELEDRQAVAEYLARKEAGETSGRVSATEARRILGIPSAAAPLLPVPTTVGGIRALLLPASQAAFDTTLTALDLADLGAVGKFQRKWWCQAAYDSDPSLADIDPDEPLFPSPFRR